MIRTGRTKTLDSSRNAAAACFYQLLAAVKFFKMIRIIKDKTELRKGNLIFVDSIVFPPNFITAKPQILGDGWEEDINKEWENCAFLNAKEQYMKDLFGNEMEKNEVKVEQLEKEDFDTFPKWKMSYKKETKEASFIHQVQNNYEDWTGEKLIP
jgi:hypothetical protein